MAYRSGHTHVDARGGTERGWLVSAAATWWRTLRPRPDWLPRASIGLGIAATCAMNVAAGSRGGAGGALLGVLFPVGLVLSLETLIWLVRRMSEKRRGLLWCAGASLPLAGLAAITGTVSYLHGLTVAQWTAAPGEPGMWLTEHLIPLVADLMIATGSVALVAIARTRGRSAPVAKSAPSAAAVPAAVPASSAARPSRGQPGDNGKRRRGRGPAPFPPIQPERLPDLLAMTERDLAAELTRVAGKPVTRWKATQFKKLYATSAGASNGHGSASGSGEAG